ncbi:uncharacterized protein LOC126839921 [Adelges cooleyi]|uniref:uncharacterized protein LOC126839921 n=1 Tax=Adelges cooleyi TaxID=133065 RepID=UPI0021802260|nr:uncharacterized protein LOC126839921 [Adelges cooleyi]
MQNNDKNKETNTILNSICEVKIDGKMALVSLYDDLPHFEYDETIDRLKETNIKYQNYILELNQRIKCLEDEKSNLKSVNMVLSKNITSLYKTAFSEIQRKDKIINDLRARNVPSFMHSSKHTYQSNLAAVGSSSNKPSLPEITNKPDVLDHNENLYSSNVVIQPNQNVPKTIFSQRMYQKLTKTNEIAQESTTTAIFNFKDDIGKNKDNIVQHNTPEDVAASSNKNISIEDPNSTLVICDSDLTQSDCENELPSANLSTSSLKDKENVLLGSIFSKLKQPIKSKKRMVIAPATIGVNNLSKPINSSKIEQLSSKAIKNTLPKSASIVEDNKNIQQSCVVKNTPHCGENKNKLNSTVVRPKFLSDNICSPNIKSDSKCHELLRTNANNNQLPSVNIEVEQVPIIRKRTVVERSPRSQVIATTRKSSSIVNTSQSTSNVNISQSTSNVRRVSVNEENKSSPHSQGIATKRKSSSIVNTSQSSSNVRQVSVKEENETIRTPQSKNQVYQNASTKIGHTRKSTSTECDGLNSSKKPTPVKYSYNSPVIRTSVGNNDKITAIPTDKTDEPSINIEVEQGTIFQRSKRRVIARTDSELTEHNQELKKGRRVKLITIQDHCSKPLKSFNGAKKTDIDVSKKSVLIEKVVESSSHFYVPPVKRKRPINFSSADL